MSETTNTRPTDAEIMQNIIDALDITAAKLADKSGYKSKSSIYHVVNGINSITIDMAKKICKAYPEINFAYITTGNLPILIPSKLMPNKSTMVYSIDEEIKKDEDEENLHDSIKEIKSILYRILDKM